VDHVELSCSVLSGLLSVVVLEIEIGSVEGTSQRSLIFRLTM